MNSREMRTLRVLSLSVAVCMMPWLLVKAFLWVVVTWVVHRNEDFAFEAMHGDDRLRAAALLLCCLFYGVYRALVFHPLANSGYRKLLQTTPWTIATPMPFGPVELAWQDLTLIVPFAAAWVDGVTSPLYVVSVFLGVYLLSIVAMEVQLRQWDRRLYVFGFGAGLVALFRDQPIVAALVPVALYPLCRVGMRRLLASVADQEFNRKLLITTEQPDAQLGWPHAQNGPADRPQGLAAFDGLVLSLLAGWLFYCCYGAGIRNPPVVDSFVLIGMTPYEQLVYRINDRAAVGWAFVGLPAVIGGIVRVGVYWSGAMPSLNFWARIWKLRPILPGFDRIFVAPIAAVCAGMVVPVICALARLPSGVNASVSLSAVMMCLLMIGPTLAEWRLAGDNRTTWMAHAYGGHFEKC